MELGHVAVPALLLATIVLAAQAADLTLRFGTPFVTNSNLHKAMEKFAEVVAQGGGGKIKVQVYADSQIGDIQQPGSPGPSPSGIHARPKTQAMSASNSGQVERLVGQVVQVDGDFGQLSLQLGQSGSVLVLSFDGNTMFDNASPDTVNGMLVEVEGRARTDGTLYASAVETLFPDTGVEAEGMLAGTNAPGLLNMVAEDGTGASMTSALVGTTLGVVVDDSTGYGIHLGNEDMGGLPVLFDAGHIAAGQRIEIDSDFALQPDYAGNPAQAQPYMVELLRQTLQGTVQNYQPGESGAAEFDLVLTPSSYLGIMNAGTGTVHVYQRYTTQATIGIQDGMNLSVRGFLFCTDETDNVPPGTTLHFAMVASSITGN